MEAGDFRILVTEIRFEGYDVICLHIVETVIQASLHSETWERNTIDTHETQSSFVSLLFLSQTAPQSCVLSHNHVTNKCENCV